MVKACEQDAIKFTAGPRPEVHIGVREEDGYWHFSVSDNAIGIASEYAQRFFFRSFLRPQGPYPGSGIGLSICKKIVEHHGGRI